MKPEIGKISELTVLRSVSIGYFLDGEELGDILLPNSSAPEVVGIGDKLRVFIYCDSEDRIIATARPPVVQAGEAAVLKVVDVTDTGAFLDWGLMKDLLVPYREQIGGMEWGKSYLVYVYLDEVSQRIVASMRLHRFLNKTPPPFKVGQEVELLLGQASELGHVAMVGKEHYGMVYHNEIFRRIEPGERCRGFIKNLRPDGKIDLSLQKAGSDAAPDLGEVILEALRQNKGFLMLNDATPPIIIYQKFGVSKKVFKRAIGMLYKERKIVIEPTGIRLV